MPRHMIIITCQYIKIIAPVACAGHLYLRFIDNKTHEKRNMVPEWDLYCIKKCVKIIMGDLGLFFVIESHRWVVIIKMLMGSQPQFPQTQKAAILHKSAIDVFHSYRMNPDLGILNVV